jgi:hypothetical protein
LGVQLRRHSAYLTIITNGIEVSINNYLRRTRRRIR